jgi:hypothetical protein
VPIDALTVRAPYDIQNHLAAGSEKAKQLDAWRIFLEELERKVNTLKWIKTDDIWCVSPASLHRRLMISTGREGGRRDRVDVGKTLPVRCKVAGH